MGTLKYIIGFCCLWIQQFSSQQYQIQYEVAYKPKLKDSTIVKDFYVLTFNPEQSISIFRSANSDNNLNTIIYKNFSKDEFVEYESIVNSFYEMEYEFEHNWKLIDSEKIIAGYPCHKAEIKFGGRNWEAWYTTEIPFQDGPYKFSGLPGLILEVSSQDKDYHFTINEIEKQEVSSISKLTAIPFKTSEIERKFKLELIEDPVSEYRKQLLRLKNKNMQISVSFNGKEIPQKDTEAQIIKNFHQWRKEHSNPIEKGKIWVK